MYELRPAAAGANPADAMGGGSRTRAFPSLAKLGQPHFTRPTLLAVLSGGCNGGDAERRPPPCCARTQPREHHESVPAHK